MPPARPSVLALALALCAAPAAAQHPAPAGEVAAPIWSAGEAGALAHVRRLLAVARTDRKLPIRLPQGGMLAGDYRITCFQRTADGRCLETANGDPATGLILLAWPETRSEAARRGIILHADGTTLCCDLDPHDDSGITADLVLARGGAGRFADALRQPGTSESGHFWYWLEQIAQAVSVEVFDEHGAPRAGCQVAFVGDGKRASTEPALPPGPWPAGTATVDARGQARLSGPPAKDLVLVVTIPEAGDAGQFDSGYACEQTPAGLRIVLSSDAVRRVVVGRNESVAIAVLKNLCSAQAQVQATGAIDADSDGRGEFGYFGELTGATVVRGHPDRKIRPPVLSRTYAQVAGSRVARNGYLFQLYLPGRDGAPVAEAATGGGKTPAGADLAVDADRAEVCWCAFAWPISPESGQRAFFVNQTGEVFCALNRSSPDDPAPRYVGHARPPAPEAAFAPGARGICGDRANNAKGADGQTWAVWH